MVIERTVKKLLQKVVVTWIRVMEQGTERKKKQLGPHFSFQKMNSDLIFIKPGIICVSYSICKGSYKSLGLTLANWRGFWGNGIVCVCFNKVMNYFSSLQKTLWGRMLLAPLYRWRNWSSERVWINCSRSHNQCFSHSSRPLPATHWRNNQGTSIIDWMGDGRRGPRGRD